MYMNFVDFLMTFSEVVGTIAFAISGATVAIRYRLDLFGVIMLGGFTALGGGTIRDLLMGNTPPRMFTSYTYLLLAVLTSFITFTISYFMRGYDMKRPERLWNFINFVDALGLGAFVVTGTRLPMLAGYGDNIFMCVFLGMTTGVGGGVLRDLMIHDIPAVLRKHIYAVAAIIGGVVYYGIVRLFRAEAVATVACVAVTVIIRMLATKYRWNLPRIKFPQDMY